MTPEDAVKKMKAIADGSYYADQKYSDGSRRLFDAENQHSNADDLLCELLNSLGHRDVVAAFKTVPKWYA